MSKAANQTEEAVKARLRQFLPRYFDFAEEVAGDGPYQRVRADFLCRPRDNLVEMGWERCAVVIEAKGYETEDEHMKTAVRVIRQAIIYRFSVFRCSRLFPETADKIRPEMVLIYPPVAALLGIPMRSTNPRKDFDDGLQAGLARLAARFRIGELRIQPTGFEVRMHDGPYFNTRHGFNGSNRPARDRQASE